MKKKFLCVALSAMMLLPAVPIHAKQNTTINKTFITLPKKNSYTLKIKGTKKKVKWSSSKKKVVAVTKSGKVIAKKSGTAYITAKVNGQTLKCEVSVRSHKYFESLSSPSSERTIKSAWNYCSAVYDMRAKDLRARHIKGCMEDGTYVVDGKEKHASPTTKTKIKSLFNLMLDYALEYELVDKNYARTFNLSDDVIKDVKEAKKDHIDFTDEEIKKLWDHLYDTDYVDVILIQCYSGWRPQELGLIELKNVDLENWFFIGGMKTDAGKDRLVPIHPRIRDLVKHRYQEAINLGSDYLINCTDTKTHRSSLKMTYDKYRHRFEKIVKKLELNPDHRAHDPRIQFSTMAKRDKVDEYALKYMMGHKINDITEATYTKRKPEWLMAEIMKIK